MTDYYCENCEFFEDKSTDNLIDGYCKKYNQSLNFYDWWEKCDNCVIETLESENAALRERLERTVELPCKIGDKVYAIFPIEDKLKILDGTFVGIEEVVSDFKGCMCAIIVRQAKDGHYFNTYWDLGQFNRTWWADKEIVESKLAEVMGNNEM